MITTPVFTDLSSVKPSFFFPLFFFLDFWGFDLVPPKQTCYKCLHELYYEYCTALLLFFLDILYEKPIFSIYCSIGLILP